MRGFESMPLAPSAISLSCARVSRSSFSRTSSFQIPREILVVIAIYAHAAAGFHSRTPVKACPTSSESVKRQTARKVISAFFPPSLSPRLFFPPPFCIISRQQTFLFHAERQIVRGDSLLSSIISSCLFPLRFRGSNLIFSSTRLIWMKELDNEQFKLYIYKIFRKMFRERNSEFDVKFDKWNYVQSIE